MAEPIRISAMGRDAQVGDLYNYFTDVIIPSWIDVPNGRKTISNTVGDPELLFLYQQPENCKLHFLGINSHLLQNMKRGSVPGHQLWFSDYLNTNSMDGDEGHAQVTLLCRVVRRTETLDLDLLRLKKGENQLRSVGMGATHVIQEVVYGAEVICSMRKALDLSQETKKSAESSIYLEAKKYLNRTITKSTSLDQVSCTVLSSIDPGIKNEMCFMSLKSFLKDLLYTDLQQNWKPMEFLLRNISAANIEAQLRSERKGDIALEKEHHHVTRKWITQEMQDISNDPLLKRFPLLEKFICYFRDLLPHFWKEIDEAYQTLEMFPDEKALEEMIYISNWLKEIIDWHADRRKDIQEICWLLKDTDLVLLNKQEIEAEMAKSNCKIAKLFVLNVEHKQVPIVNDIEKFVGRKTTTALLPVLPIFSYEKERIECVRTALSKFADEAKLATWGSMNGTNYHMGFYCSTWNDAAVVTVDSSDKSSPILTSVDSPVEYLKIKKKPPLPARSFSVSSSSNSLLTPTVVANLNRKLKTEKASEPFNPNTHFAANSTAKLKDNEKSAMNIKAFNSDVDTRFVGYSRHTTDSTKTKSWMQQVQSPATAVSRNDQTAVRSKANRHSLQVGQFNLGDASAQKQWTLVAAQFQKTVASDHQTTKRSVSRKDPNLRFEQISLYETNVIKPSTSAEDKSNGQNPTVNRSNVAQVCGTSKYGMLNFQRENVIQHQEKCEGIRDRKGMRVEKIRLWNRNGDQNSRRMAHGNIKPNDNRRITEIYIDERFSALVKKGSPDIYLLNVLEKSNSDNNKWFDICRPGDPLRLRSPKDHKTIILMGTTGSGKSTLINGMINYILGVQWNEPFRFKCVREDEGVSRNQAYSQTSSVTAYTLHHQEGMAIPYSITIIDTPGYGDTRGVKRDKEITAAIHSFLTQQEIPIDEIHAACFVAASGDSRLTATQRYIIDSVLSIFGKDMKENLRLLVTFADNADPPVVGACLSANFPTTSASGDIAYSKFNSSVLYCSNAKQGDDEFSFDELFWDMGHENFKKFFIMLEKMQGRDLKSTREVIQSRRKVKQSLMDIEQELEVCLVNIENLEIFQEKVKICGYNMEATKNYMVEQTEIRRQSFTCDEKFMAYNCRKCNVTCGKYIKKEDPLHRVKRKCTNWSCKCSAADHKLDRWEWRLIPEKVTVPLIEMKAQYESNFNCKMNVEQLLNACGDNLLVAKTKVLSLLEQVAKNARLLESTALRSNVRSPSDYLSLMRSRVLEEQAPGYLTRLQTLDELQQHLTYGTPLTATKAVLNSPPPTHDSYNSGGGVGGYQGGSQSSQTMNQISPQMSSDDYRKTTATGQSSKKAEGEKMGKHSYLSSFLNFGGKKK